MNALSLLVVLIKRSVCLCWEKDLKGIFGGVKRERPHCGVEQGAEVHSVMDLQRLRDGGVKEQVIPGKKSIHTSV